MPTVPAEKSETLNFDTPQLLRHRRLRYAKDKLTTAAVGVGGWSILTSILLIFAYLLYEVLPLFTSANIDEVASYELRVDGRPMYMAMEEQNEVALRVDESGQLLFFNAATGAAVLSQSLDVDAEVTAVSTHSEGSRLMALGLSNGKVIIAKHDYLVSYPDDKRLITPRVEYPYGEDALALANAPLTAVALSESESALLIAGYDGKQLHMVRYSKEEDFLSGEVVLERQELSVPEARYETRQLVFDADQHFLYSLGGGKLISIDLSGAADDDVLLHAQMSMPQARTIAPLLGGISLLVANADGSVKQFFTVRDEQGDYTLSEVRSFDGGSTSFAMVSAEQRRKGFVALSEQGEFAIFHSTSHRELLRENLAGNRPQALALGPRANALLVEDASHMLRLYRIENEHPEVSWSALWEEVWYESYPEPDYIWQSSASTNDFEPKYSLTPLAFGTLKAAFYAMLLGAPLAICGAIYTAYFMAPALRRKVKPLIELMEALPTVILGFLAGLWLAPFMENNLAAIFMLLLVMPLGVLLVSYGFNRLPASLTSRLPEGWQPVLLIPVMLLVGALCVYSGDYVELLFFKGDMRAWLTHDAGIPFDQRNALVVGIAMGFAVIPTIFSITEDAIFAVPKHLSYGSLALGATPWQTLIGVVLPTASPGIFSALMIGMGRAVGETMIVLMATGNTPIMDANIFEGMRTLAANIAVEIPEAEVDSSHYRVLFLAAFVLFGFTFIVNSTAEVIRQRLRKKYGSL